MRGTVILPSQNDLTGLQRPRFLSSTESWQIVVAEYQADLDIINDEAKVFWNPYGTPNGNTLSDLRSKSLILMVPPHGLEPRTY